MTYKLPTKKEVAAYRKSAMATLDELDICSDRIFDIRVEAALDAVAHSKKGGTP